MGVGVVNTHRVKTHRVEVALDPLDSQWRLETRWVWVSRGHEHTAQEVQLNPWDQSWGLEFARVWVNTHWVGVIGTCRTWGYW